MAFSVNAAMFSLIRKLQPAEYLSSGRPGKAMTSRSYDMARRAVAIAPPFMADSATRVA